VAGHLTDSRGDLQAGQNSRKEAWHAGTLVVAVGLRVMYWEAPTTERTVGNGSYERMFDRENRPHIHSENRPHIHREPPQSTPTPQHFSRLSGHQPARSKETNW
jgi:hypothetical protein